jgi:spectinomycin phosphotransferase
MEQVEVDAFDDPVANQVAACLRVQRQTILDLIERTEQCAQALRAQPLEFIVCHADIHAGNVLIAANDGFYIVDWDNPILAPKERDLMFVGGGQFGDARTPPEEEALFYRGYGPTSLDSRLAYYRYERIIQDIAAFVSNYC